MQKESFNDFLQAEVHYAKRENKGLQAILNSAFPITNYTSTIEVEFVRYTVEPPKYEVAESKRRGLTYASDIKLLLRMIIYDSGTEGDRKVLDVKEQEIYMGSLPMMTQNATFVVNGIERIIVTQIHRSAGVFFAQDDSKQHLIGKSLYQARIVPSSGSWLDFEFDNRNLLYAKIDKKRKVLATTFLMALPKESKFDPEDKKIEKGYNKEQLLENFYNKQRYTFQKQKKQWLKEFVKEEYADQILKEDVQDEKGSVVLEKGKRYGLKILAKKDIKFIKVKQEDLFTKFSACDILEDKTYLVLINAGDQLTKESVDMVVEKGIKDIDVLYIDGHNSSADFRNLIVIEKNETREEALADFYKAMRPGEPVVLKSAEELVYNNFFNKAKYSLASVGRVKLNARLGLNRDPSDLILHADDIIATVAYLFKIKVGTGFVDDIDSLHNRRIKLAGEWLETQYRIGFAKSERAIRDRIAAVDYENMMPSDIINIKPVYLTVKDFFLTSQLSQFLDQNNPLSEVTHKRRISALGPGGLSKEHAGFEVRDVHASHYGRICPIETPEGQNIGLISSLACYARVNEHGFIETPYLKVENGKVTKQIDYKSVLEEADLYIAQDCSIIGKDGKLNQEMVSCSYNGDLVNVPAEIVNYIIVSPKQVVSVASSLIPFVENDDASRALMGANMQRQAVPLMKSEAPMVGTGMEAIVGNECGAVLKANKPGVVSYADSSTVITKNLESRGEVSVYNLDKFKCSNHNTCINNRPLVKVGDMVKEGEIIADGSATDKGVLSLGKNIKVAIMPWFGYTFEDSIVASEQIVRDDSFTSIHIEELEIFVRDTKLGSEEITRDIPKVSEDMMVNLDESGIINIGAKVKPGDVLVGKVTPKGESFMTPEEKLLRALFAEKASEIKDSSLRVPPGSFGVVVDIVVLSRKGVSKTQREIAIDNVRANEINDNSNYKKEIARQDAKSRVSNLIEGQKLEEDFAGHKKGAKITKALTDSIAADSIFAIKITDAKIKTEVAEIKKHLDRKIGFLDKEVEKNFDKLQKGDDLPAGILKVVKIFLASKRKIQPGDKIAGRHGNKGVVSRIVPIEDMPYMENGEPVDMLLNPLGLPARMNFGQILESTLGFACKGIGNQIGVLLDDYFDSMKKDIKGDKQKEQKLRLALKKFLGEKECKFDDLDTEDIIEIARQNRSGISVACPVFEGVGEKDIDDHLKLAGMDDKVAVKLRDGMTGEYFDHNVTVGYMYMIKLNHLVDDKIHARSVGPYSLVTQQPLGGKSQFGGQRLGEMEVWALQAHGAAYTLQEMLTVKSDDVEGRSKMFESIVKGEVKCDVTLPESFHVLGKELQSLCLNIEFNFEEKNNAENV